MNKVNVLEKFSRFSEHWSPKVVGRVNDCEVKLAKIEGPFIWHHHDDEDEMFLVIRGRLLMRLRDRDVVIEEGEFFIVPRGVEHQPVAESETWIMLIEPAGTLNTGNVENERTVHRPEVI